MPRRGSQGDGPSPDHDHHSYPLKNPPEQELLVPKDANTDANEERRELRRTLRHLGWNVGAMGKQGTGVVVEFWPSPHTGPVDGVTPLRISATSKTEALQQAVARLTTQPDGGEPAR
jgi:hypothetical protein